MGGFLAQWFEIKTRNVLRVANRADERLASIEESDRKDVPTRVAMRIFDEAAYCDDEDQVVVDYLGGLLASSRQLGRNSDLANSYAALISRLAIDHLRVHFVVYKCMHELYRGDNFNVYDSAMLGLRPVFVPYDVFADTFGEDVDVNGALYWLRREELIASFVAGPNEHIEKDPNRSVSGPGLTIGVTVLGMELYLWGLGRPGRAHELLGSGPGDFQLTDVSVPVARAVRGGPTLVVRFPAEGS
jgi:hypothetical protein